MADLPSDLIPSKQAAKVIGRRHEWLCRLRKRPGGGPIPWYDIEGRFFYSIGDLSVWIASCRRGGAQPQTSTEGATS